MKRSLTVFMALALAIVVLPVSAARADTNTITFEPTTYSIGSIDGQGGWGGSGGSAINTLIDQEVVSTGANQSFRMSNAYTTGSFGDQVFSPSLANEAGETTAASGGLSGGTRQTRFEATWDFTSATGAPQPGLSTVVSPDRGDGARMSWIQMTDTGGAGLDVNFYDYQTGIGDFFLTNIATGLSRTTAHTIKIQMDFVDGVGNDIVKVWVDSILVHTGTSWEDYYREVESTSTRTVDSLLFRVAGTPAPVTAGQGFLFDNLTLFSGPSAPVCTATGFTRDNLNLTAALVNPTGTVSGTLNATGCNIGVYYGPGTTGSVTGANIFGANYYGVVVNAAAVNVTGSTIHDIGDNPFTGAQHGVGVLYTTVNQAGVTTGLSATGTLSATTISKYQKNGVVISGAGAVVTVNNNTVTGEGPINYIAQNGIQISFGASAKLVGNNVSLNNYTPSKVTACGLLIYKAGGVSGATKAGISYIKADNNFHDNETNICNFGKGGGFSL